MKEQEQRFHSRVIRAAEYALQSKGYASVLDVLMGMMLLPESGFRMWKAGRTEFLLTAIQGSPQKLTNVQNILREWAAAKGLEASETRYTRASREGPVDLRVSPFDNEEFEKSWRAVYIQPGASKTRREKAAVQEQKQPVFEVVRDSKCSECGAEINGGGMLMMERDQPLCLHCAGLGDLEFLPSGDTALTRWTTKYSARTAVVVRFSRSRGRYERQGILAEPRAIERAEQECEDDAEERKAQRAKAALARVEEDKAFAKVVADEIRRLWPGVPPAEAREIAAHTAVPSSGRVGRSAAGRSLDPGALRAAVVASIRHRHTNYDELLARGVERPDARERVADAIEQVLERWRMIS